MRISLVNLKWLMLFVCLIAVIDYIGYLHFANFIYTARTNLKRILIEECSDEPPNLMGPIEVNLTVIELDDVDRIDFGVDPAGHYKPTCKPRDRVAIVIPFRNRSEQLAIFLNNIHKFLKKQQIEYQIFVAEQTAYGVFNRAQMRNIGFIEANKYRKWDCFIFHDVDLLPLNDRNLYKCPEQPRHHSASIDQFDYKLPYVSLTGGVLAVPTRLFYAINGYSNRYWGWGGEDDDLSYRIVANNLSILRYPMEISTYMMLKHRKDKPNPVRYVVLGKVNTDYKEDGLNSIRYTLTGVKFHNLYTRFLAQVFMPANLTNITTYV